MGLHRGRAVGAHRHVRWHGRNRVLSAQDWEFHIRAIAAGLSYIKVPEPDSFWRASQAGSISSAFASQRHVCNRVRLLKGVIAFLRSEDALTRRRRRILAAEFYVHAFRAGLSRHLGLKIWRTGRQTRIVGPLRFVAVLASEFDGFDKSGFCIDLAEVAGGPADAEGSVRSQEHCLLNSDRGTLHGFEGTTLECGSRSLSVARNYTAAEVPNDE